MNSFEYKDLLITDIGLDLRNPRLKDAENQTEALLLMVADQDLKLEKLAEHIIKFGMNPTDSLCVIEDSENLNQYIALEGNRRITTLKILHNPEILQNKSSELYRKMKKMLSDFNKSPINKIRCTVFQQEEEAYEWIRLKHTGENKGAGTVSWSTNQQENFQDRYFNSKSKNLKILELCLNSKYIKLDEIDADKITMTNLARLLGDPDVQEFLGMKFVNSEPVLTLPESEVMKGMQRILVDLSNAKINVRDIYLKQDRLDYLSTFQPNEIPNYIDDVSHQLNEDLLVSDSINTNGDIKEVTKEELEISEGAENINNNGSNSNIQNQGAGVVPTLTIDNARQKKAKKLSGDRKYLIPTKCIIRINNDRINKIYKELRSIEVEKYENLVAIAFRVFVELSCDYYINLNKSQLTKINCDKKLFEKIQAICDHFENSNIMTKHELKPIRVSVSNSNNVTSVNTLNSYVHNIYHQPVARELKLTWDNYQKFIEKIWE